MAKFDDLDKYWDPGLTLTVLGKEYTLPLPSAELGLWCRRVASMAGDIKAASTDVEIQAAVDRVNALPSLPGDLTLHERVLGDVYQQLVDAQVPDPYIQFCGATGYAWILGGEEAAERYWTSGGRPESAARGNRADRRAQARAGQTSTGEANATPIPGSTSGTKSPTTSRGNGRARRSRGQKS